MVYKKVRGLYKGSKKGTEVLKKGVIRIGVKGLRVKGFIKVYIYIYKLLVNCIKT